jgi:hypothetical protein
VDADDDVVNVVYLIVVGNVVFVSKINNDIQDFLMMQMILMMLVIMVLMILLLLLMLMLL